MKITSLVRILFFFLLVACACINQFVQLPSDISFSNEISSSLQNELKKIDTEASSLINADSSDEQWINAQHSFFLIADNKIKAWSKNDFKPDVQSTADDFSIRLKQNKRGKFLEKKWRIGVNSYLLAVLPLEFTYDIVNDFLRPYKSSLLPRYGEILSSDSPNGFCVELGDSKCAFKIKSSKIDLFQDSMKAIMMFVCLMLLLVIMVSLVFHQILFKVKRRLPEVLFLSSLVLFFSVRIAMVEFNFPRFFFSHELFDPSHYASSSYNVSIADLLINSVVVCVLALILFTTYKRFSFIRKVNRLNRLFRLLLSGSFVFVLYLSFLFPYLYVESIYHNSSISLEITDSLSFDTFRITAFISLIFGCISSYLIIRIFLRLVLFVNGSSINSFLRTYFLGSLLFVIFFFLNEKDYWIPLFIGLVFTPIIFLSKTSYRNTGLSFKAYAYLLLIILAFSLECALSVLKFHEEKQRESQFKFGSNYLVDQDILAEFLLNEASKSIANDEEIKSDIYEDRYEEQVRQRITQYYLTSYFDRYEISVTIFSNDSVSTYRNKLNELINDQYATSFPNVYFINDPASDTLKRYISLIPFKQRKEGYLRYVALDLSLKKIIPETVFPELMVDKRYGQIFKDKNFSYALFNNSTIHSSFGDFNYEKLFKDEWLGQIDLYNDGIISDGFHHVAIEYQPHRIAVVSAPVYSIDYVVINFSFYIALGLSVILILLLTFALISGIKGKRLGYSSRIQLYVYLAFFIPLLIVSIVILRLIIISAENQKETDYLLKAKILEERVAPILDNYLDQGKGYKNELEAKLIEMAEVANLDATVFSMNGEVIASSEPLIFENKLLSGLVNREAWHSLLMNHETQHVQSEFIGRLSYKSVYWAIRSPASAKVTAILSIPFFESAYSLERTEINVVSAILGVFSIAFILFSLLSYFAINGLIAPLKFITKALRTISLSGRNSPINWKGNDEIGVMTQEYNRMLINLEESKKELQKSQKEIAWREVAQQVAHEIKNPLTPMKLGLQQLELALLNKEVDFDKSKNSVRVVLEQIDILNDIASSFSSFATLPPLNIKPINLTDILYQTIKLYSHHTDISFNATEIVDCIALCDEAILSRAISNIVLNGIQAAKPNKQTNVIIKITKNTHDCILSIQDNGSGISEDLKDKIFKPHFTTKATGSGLGLAIVKQTLELCNCSIWFDTEMGIGTVFYIQLPLHDELKLTNL